METPQDQLDQAKHQMLTRDLRGRGITDARVLQAIAELPRELFVPEAYRAQTYSDEPLPIGSGQTISQPYIVALMTQLLRLDHDLDVLEVGTGSGYQTALLSRLCRKVYTIEKLPELSAAARQRLDRLAITNVEFGVGDGSRGWSEPRAFERILLTAAVPAIPKPLADALSEGGRLVAPVGGPMTQELILAEKFRGKLVETDICGCRFVRLIGEYGFRD
jgi:protein-L-isoaspartate(D-aspartate) O-methyltransferase